MPSVVNKNQSLQDYIWFLYILLFPFYFFPSGNLQIADFCIIILVSTSFKSLYKKIKTNKVAFKLGLFIFYVFIINTFWFLIYYDLSIIKNNLFYLFNFLVFLFCLTRTNDIRFWNISFIALVSSLLLQLVLFPYWKTHYRPIIFFNNPNQLGYWALLIGSMLHLLSSKKIIRFDFFLILNFGILFFSLLSLSRAGMASSITLFVIAFFSKSLIKASVIGSIFLVSFIVINPTFYREMEISQKVVNRIENQGVHDNPEGRGYDKFVLYPHHLILGAGEGKYDRFRKAFYLGEIHSSLGTILFSYGIIGFILFINFLYSLCKGRKLRYNLILLPILIYSLTHMGLRFSLFWVVLAFIFGTGENIAKKQTLQANASKRAIKR